MKPNQICLLLLALTGRVAADECSGLSDLNGRCIPDWCASWFDGCNSCSVGGKALLCTEMFCLTEGDAKCVQSKKVGRCDVFDSQGNCVPEDCAQWWDGCNSCKVGEALSCTRKFCETYEAGKCLDAAEESKDCPGIVDQNGHCVDAGCESWYDGCNTCTVNEAAGDDDVTNVMACTKKACIVVGEGKCLDEEPPPGKDTKPCLADDYGNCVEDGCDSWFDGCNQCKVDEAAGALGCTKKFCAEPRRAFCADAKPSGPGGGSGGACEDSATWHKRDAPEKDCTWVSEDAKKRCLVKDANAIYAFEECKGICGTCGAGCVDDASWHKADEPSKDCAWAKRVLVRCAVTSASGEAGYEACKFACNTCEPV